MPGAFLVRPGLAVTADRHINQLWIDRFQRFITQAQTLHHPGAKLLEHDVVFAQQLLDDLQRFGLFQIQRQTALVAVQISVAGRDTAIMRRQHPQQIHTGWRFDAQHLGAHVRQQQRGERPRQQGREIENLQ